MKSHAYILSTWKYLCFFYAHKKKQQQQKPWNSKTQSPPRNEERKQNTYNNKMLVGLVSACYIKSQRIAIFKVFRCSFENQFNYSLLNVRHGWGGVKC